MKGSSSSSRQTSAKGEKLVGALASGIKLLRYLARARVGVGVNQAARDLGLNPSTCFNLLKTLVHERLVTFDPERKTYALGLGLVVMARGALDKASHVAMARPHLEAIARDFDVTATLWQRIGDSHMMLVDHVERASAVRIHMSVGQRLPIFIAALGRCMAAHAGLSRAQLRQRFSALRWQNAPTFDRYWDDVERARGDGYAIDQDHYVRGVTTVSAPVFAGPGIPAMAISAVGFSGQFTPARLKALAVQVRDHAAQLSAALADDIPTMATPASGTGASPRKRNAQAKSTERSRPGRSPLN